MTTYCVADDGRAITCLRCNLTSHNADDVANLYCGHCHAFHEPRAPDDRVRSSVIGATHVKAGGLVEAIVDTWGIDPDGRLAKPSEGGFGVITQSGRRIGMFEAESYSTDAAAAAAGRHVLTIDECDRQAIILAIAYLAAERPGWNDLLGRIADTLTGRDMYEHFKELRGRDRLTNLRAPGSGERGEQKSDAGGAADAR